MKILKRIFWTVLIVLLVIIGFIFYDGYQTYQKVLNEVSLSDKVTSIRSNENYTSLSEVPNDYKNAIIAIEDHRFYEHNGIDIISTGRAVVTNLKEKSLSEGGSTITQQVAKNLYLTRRKKVYQKSNRAIISF